MPDSPTYCVECEHVTPRTRQLDGWRWRCMKAPVVDVPHWLGPSVRGSDPWGRCMEKNFGDCPDFEPRREAPNDGG